MIRQFLDLSTAHASPIVRAWLEMQAYENGRQSFDGLDTHSVAAFRHGWMMHVPDPTTWGQEEPPLPLDLRDVCLAAAMNNCDYVLFDADAEVLVNLPTWADPTDAGDEGLTEEEKAAFAAVNRDHFQEEDAGLADELDDPLTALENVFSQGVAHGGLPRGEAIRSNPAGPLPSSPMEAVYSADLIELKEAAEELRGLMQDALTVHIYDPDNDGPIPDDCPYTASLARITKALDALS